MTSIIKNKKTSLVYLTLILLFVFNINIDLVYAGKSADSGKIAENIVNDQTQKQSGPAQGAEASRGGGVNGVDLANALNSAESAGAASGQQSSGSALNLGMSGVFAVAAGYFAYQQNYPTAAIMAMNSAQALMQAMNQGSTSKANRRVGNDFKSYGDLTDQSGNTNNNGETSNNGSTTTDNSETNLNSKSLSSTGPLPPGAQEILKKLEDNGFKVDLDKQTFTTPDGKSISMSDAKNGGAVESKLGLPPGSYGKGMALAEDLAKRQGMSGMTGDSSSVAGGGGNSNISDPYDNSNASGRKSAVGSDARTPASTLVAGLTTKYNGENIGVAADDIFLMVTRRYQLKHKQDSFITPEQPQRGSLIAPKK